MKKRVVQALLVSLLALSTVVVSIPNEVEAASNKVRSNLDYGYIGIGDISEITDSDENIEKEIEYFDIGDWYRIPEYNWYTPVKESEPDSEKESDESEPDNSSKGDSSSSEGNSGSSSENTSTSDDSEDSKGVEPSKGDSDDANKIPSTGGEGAPETDDDATIGGSVGDEVTQGNGSTKFIQESGNPDPDTLVISFAGDCTLGNYKGQGYSGSFNEMLEKVSPDYFLANVKPIFATDDITFVNLEGAITNETQKVSKQYPIKAELAGLDILREGSVEVVNLANNHIYDCGEAGFNECTSLLSGQDIAYCGEGYKSLVTVAEKNVKVGFLGYRAFSVTDTLKTQIQADINDLKASGASIVCVMFHYGTEGTNYASKDQQTISRYAIDCGADVVMGGHPHVLQGVEVYKGKVIDYSLGNFCFGANKNPSDKDTIIFQQTFIKDNQGNWVYGNSDILPCSISSVTNKNNFQPTLVTGAKETEIINRLKDYSANLGNTIPLLKN